MVGTRPKRAPGLEKFPNDDAALNAELDALWNGPNPPIAPPGTGKTTLAQLLATETNCHFQQISAVTSGAKELRDVLS
ncbi:MAG: AAA family ATPase, partial [Thermoguttaceae bacterium]|nr:AAA family ATPase [Thermoguttaceae bacterium]